MDNVIPVIILAAGASTRMGEPKQLLVYQGKTLLQHAIDTVKSAGFFPVVVVLGAFYDKIVHTIAQKVIVVDNKLWEQGMASSLKAGLATVKEQFPHTQAVLCMLCDQPLITPAHLQALKQARGKKPIVATRYHDIDGVPVIFERVYFERLLEMEGATGARKLIKKYHKDVYAISFEPASRDVDTPEAYRRLLEEDEDKDKY
jgi:molybdenum cofactor cytidylyltransferase